MLVALVLSALLCGELTDARLMAIRNLPRDSYILETYPDGEYLIFKRIPFAMRFSDEGMLDAVGVRPSLFSTFMERQFRSTLQGVWNSNGVLLTFDDKGRLEGLKQLGYSLGVRGDVLTYHIGGFPLTSTFQTTSLLVGWQIQFVTPIIGGPPLDEEIRLTRKCIALSPDTMLIFSFHKYAIECSVWTKDGKITTAGK